MSPEKIEIYKQCHEQRKHYDIMSWSIGGAVLLIDGFLLRWTFDQPIPISNRWGVFLVNTIGIFMLLCWLSIYERNRMFVEVANELSRDIEREWKIEGIGIRNGKYATGPGEVIFKNTDIDGTQFSERKSEKQLTRSSHIGIRGLMFLIFVVHCIAIYQCLK